MKDNKLIAEFMGYKLSRCNNGLAWDIGKSIPSHKHLFPIQGVLHRGNELKFHTSWDWLMPVIAKCREVSEAEDDNWEMVYYSLEECYIDVTYKAVIEFIKQYNNGK